MVAAIERVPQGAALFQAPDAFEHMGAALFLSKASLVAVLTAYLDESYNQHTQKNPNDPLCYTVGCWVSTFGQWKKFQRQWKLELRAAGVDWFHMSEYESRLNEYKDWSEVKRVGVLKRLHRIIKEHVVHGVTLSVNCAAYDKIMTPEWKAIYGKTYYSFDVRMVMKYLAEWAGEKEVTGPIHYVFAELQGQGNELDKIFRYLLKTPETKKRFRLSGMWSKGLMRDVSQLQAADIVAYELNKRTVNEIGTDSRYVRLSLNNLARGIYQSRLMPLYFGEQELVALQRETINASP